MLFNETYREIEFDTIGLYKERGSKFIAYCLLVKNKKEVTEQLNRIKKKEKSANHYCYAYVLKPDGSDFRLSDDGEPSSTAGKPIMSQIKFNALTNILIVVVRYFGGKKLGIPGLIRSYKTAAIEAIKNTRITTKDIQEEYDLFFNYKSLNIVMKKIKDWKLNILKSDLKINCKIKFLVSKKESDIIFNYFNEKKNIEIKYIQSR